MNSQPIPAVSREALVHQLYEAAELEHNLMCTYLYAAFSLKSGWIRSPAGVRLQLGSASTAAWTALLTSCPDESGASASTCPVAGLVTASVSVAEAASHRPPT